MALSPALQERLNAVFNDRPVPPALRKLFETISEPRGNQGSPTKQLQKHCSQVIASIRQDPSFLTSEQPHFKETFQQITERVRTDRSITADVSVTDVEDFFLSVARGMQYVYARHGEVFDRHTGYDGHIFPRSIKPTNQLPGYPRHVLAAYYPENTIDPEGRTKSAVEIEQEGSICLNAASLVPAYVLLKKTGIGWPRPGQDRPLPADEFAFLIGAEELYHCVQDIGPRFEELKKKHQENHWAGLDVSLRDHHAFEQDAEAEVNLMLADYRQWKSREPGVSGQSY